MKWFALGVVCVGLLYSQSHKTVEQTYWEAERRDFISDWNAVTLIWNDAAVDIEANVLPIKKLKRLDSAIRHLQRNQLWPQAQ